MAGTSREVWQKRVARWRESGLSSKEFGAETGVNPRTLAYWGWRLGASRRARPAKVAAPLPVAPPVRWLEVVAGESEPAGPSREPPGAALSGAPPPLELVVGTLTLRVPVGFDEPSLRRVLAALEAR